MSAIDRLRERLHKRKRNRDRKRKLHQGNKARREGRAVKKLRRLIRFLFAPRTQYDAVTVGNIPGEARAVAGYADGRYANLTLLKTRFPHARLTTIAVSPATIADCLDVEPGDASNADCAGWYRRFKAERPHRKPIFYTSASNVAALVAVLAHSGIARKDYILWSAHYTDKHICSLKSCGYPEADATQFTTHGERVDESKCKPSYWERGK